MLIKLEEIFITFFKYWYFNQVMFIRLSLFKGFSGGGATVRESALIRRNRVALGECNTILSDYTLYRDFG